MTLCVKETTEVDNDSGHCSLAPARHRLLREVPIAICWSWASMWHVRLLGVSLFVAMPTARCRLRLRLA